MEKQGNHGPRRLVLVPFPFQGHTTPMLQLGTLLHSKGFAITIAHTEFNPPNPSNHPAFDFLPLPDNLSCTETCKLRLADVDPINISCKASLHEFLKHGQVDGIIYDSLMYFAEVVANHMNIPSMILRTSCASFLLEYGVLPQLLPEGCIPLQDRMLQQELEPELNPEDLPLSRGNVEDTLKLLEIASNTRSSSGIIWNTIDYLEHSSLLRLQQHYKVPFFPIGPLHKMAPASSTSFLEEDTRCIAWLEKQAPKSVLYVSIGSLASMDEKELVETAWGLANGDQPFLWVIRPGSVLGSNWTDELALPHGFREKVGERGQIVKWAPQKEVLAHGAVGGFWSHCGWNSTLESICEGVPMICSPHLLDQQVNARYLCYEWRVGFELENNVLERGHIERTIRRLLVDKDGEELRQRAFQMKQKVNAACTCEGGSSYSSLNHLTEFF